MLIEIIVGIILIILIIGNKIAISESKKRRISMCGLHNRRIMLGFSLERADLSNDLFLSRNVLKMHNTGTDLKKETDRLEFVPIADSKDYYGKFRM